MVLNLTSIAYNASIAYAASIVDTQGTITIRRHKDARYSPGYSTSMDMSITTANEYLVWWLRFTFGGYVYKSSERTWRWVIDKRQAAQLLELMLPYLETKKRQARLALEFQKGKQIGGGKSEEQFATENKLRLAMRELNARKPTMAEQKMIELISENSLPYKYVGNGSFIIGGLNPDFVNINGAKKVIEIFGRYWHRNYDGKEWKRTKEGRTKFFKEFGFDTLVIWTDEMSDRMAVLEKIRAFEMS